MKNTLIIPSAKDDTDPRIEQLLQNNTRNITNYSLLSCFDLANSDKTLRIRLSFDAATEAEGNLVAKRWHHKCPATPILSVEITIFPGCRLQVRSFKILSLEVRTSYFHFELDFSYSSASFWKYIFILKRRPSKSITPIVLSSFLSFPFFSHYFTNLFQSQQGHQKKVQDPGQKAEQQKKTCRLLFRQQESREARGSICMD